MAKKNGHWKFGSLSAPSPLLAARKSPLIYQPRPIPLAPLSSLVGINPSMENLLPPGVALVLRIGLVFGLRIGEILSVSASQVLSGDRIVVRGEKGSRGGLIVVPGVSEFVRVNSAAGASWLLWPFSYSLVYRWARKIALPRLVGSGVNCKVTHLGRHLLAQQSAPVGGKEIAGDVLRHRSTRSVDHYL